MILYGTIEIRGLQTLYQPQLGGFSMWECPQNGWLVMTLPIKNGWLGLPPWIHVSEVDLWRLANCWVYSEISNCSVGTSVMIHDRHDPSQKNGNHHRTRYLPNCQKKWRNNLESTTKHGGFRFVIGLAQTIIQTARIRHVANPAVTSAGTILRGHPPTLRKEIYCKILHACSTTT